MSLHLLKRVILVNLILSSAAFAKRELRTIVLKNKLEIVLISDSEAKQSGASMDVRVGSLQNPKKHEGLAHYLEHMLFLGTKKYPKYGSYLEYIKKNQGNMNAYTALENTNYHFGVNHDALDGALDRFAQFFTAPLFSPVYLEKEKNAVNSEHQKNIPKDGWRLNRLYFSMHRAGHPATKFTTGNRETLKNVDEKVVQAFYEEFYSANQMKLVIVSKKSLNELDVMARQHFANIPNRNLPTLESDTEFMDPKTLPRLVEVKPYSKIQKLSLRFALPSARRFWSSKPLTVLGKLVGGEVKGSLLSGLKEEGLVSSLSAGGSSGYKFGSYFSINMELTNKGLQQYPQVIEKVFGFLNMIRKEGYKPYIFDLNSAMGALNEKYKEPANPVNLAIHYATEVGNHPVEKIEENTSLITDYSPKAFNFYLEKLVPENMIAILSHKTAKTNQVISGWGIEYSSRRPSNDWLQAWSRAKASNLYSYPAQNPFIPQKLAILSDEVTGAPYKILDDQRGTVWFQQAPQWGLPKANLRLQIFGEPSQISPRTAVVRELYFLMLNDELNEWFQLIGETGLQLVLTPVKNGVSVVATGYSEYLTLQVQDLLSRMKKMKLDSSRFANHKETLKRKYTNIDFSGEYQLAGENLAALRRESPFYEEYRSLLDSVTFAEIGDFGQKLMKKAKVFGFAYGNLTSKEVREVAQSPFKSWGAKISNYDIEKDGIRYYQFPPGQPAAYSMPSSLENSAWYSVVRLGANTPKRAAIGKILSAFWGQQFYNSLRTDQQLGYIVHADVNSSPYAQQVVARFIVQSGDYDATTVALRGKEWLNQALANIDGMSSNQFEGLKKAIKAKLLEPVQSMSEMGEKLYDSIRWYGADFNRNEKILKALDQLTMSQFVESVRKDFAKENLRQMSVYLSPKGKPLAKVQPWEELILDISEYRKTLNWLTIML